MPDGNNQILLPMLGLMVLTTVLWFMLGRAVWNAFQAATGQPPG